MFEPPAKSFFNLTFISYFVFSLIYSNKLGLGFAQIYVNIYCGFVTQIINDFVYDSVTDCASSTLHLYSQGDIM